MIGRQGFLTFWNLSTPSWMMTRKWIWKAEEWETKNRRDRTERVREGNRSSFLHRLFILWFPIGSSFRKKVQSFSYFFIHSRERGWQRSCNFFFFFSEKEKNSLGLKDEISVGNDTFYKTRKWMFSGWGMSRKRKASVIYHRSNFSNPVNFLNQLLKNVSFSWRNSSKGFDRTRNKLSLYHYHLSLPCFFTSVSEPRTLREWRFEKGKDSLSIFSKKEDERFCFLKPFYIIFTVNFTGNLKSEEQIDWTKQVHFLDSRQDEHFFLHEKISLLFANLQSKIFLFISFLFLLPYFFSVHLHPINFEWSL